MDYKITHEDAIHLEKIVGSVFNRNMARPEPFLNADIIQNNPMIAAVAVFAPLFRENEEIEEIENFLQKYSAIFDKKEYVLIQKQVDEYLRDFRELERKYY